MASWTAQLPDSDHFVVRIKYGPYRGEYDCFCSIDAFRIRHPYSKLVMPWHTADKGQWTAGDDGFVGRVIRRTEMRSGYHKRATIVIRMPWGSYPYYVRNDGTSINVMRYLDSAYKHRGMSSIASRTNYRHGKHFNSRKKMFAYYWLVQEMTPVMAYMKAFKTTYLGQAEKGVKLIMQEKDTFMAMVKTHYKDIFDRVGLDDEGIADEIAKMARDPRSTKVKLEALRLALEMRGEISGQGTLVNNGTINSPVPLGPGTQNQLAPPVVVVEAEPELTEAVVLATSLPSPASDAPQGATPLEPLPPSTTSDQEETSLETHP